MDKVSGHAGVGVLPTHDGEDVGNDCPAADAAALATSAGAAASPMATLAFAQRIRESVIV